MKAEAWLQKYLPDMIKHVPAVGTFTRALKLDDVVSASCTGSESSFSSRTSASALGTSTTPPIEVSSRRRSPPPRPPRSLLLLSPCATRSSTWSPKRATLADGVGKKRKPSPALPAAKPKSKGRKTALVSTKVKKSPSRDSQYSYTCETADHEYSYSYETAVDEPETKPTLLPASPAKKAMVKKEKKGKEHTNEVWTKAKERQSPPPINRTWKKRNARGGKQVKTRQRG